MKAASAGEALSAAANLAVILGVSVYIGSSVMGKPESGGAVGVPSDLTLSATEWTELTAGASRLGASQGLPGVVEFVDYQCEYCAQSHEQVQRYLSATEGSVMGIRHYPLPSHSGAEGAARAAICAEAQGRFQEMHEHLITSTEWHEAPDWRELAIQVDVSDLSGFERCLRSPFADARLNQDISAGHALNLEGTPTFVGPQAMFIGLLDPETLTRLASPLSDS